MKIIPLSMVLTLIGTMALAQENTIPPDSELLNDATVVAMNNAAESLSDRIGSSKPLKAIKRIGVANVANDQGKVIDHLKSMLTGVDFDFDVILINDVEWGPLLDEFQRQSMRDDIIIKDTAHELRVQGVDAVLWGSVDAFEAMDVVDGAEEGRRATARVQLTLASTMENNPGSILWTFEAKGVVDTLRSTNDAKIKQAYKDNSILVMGAGVLIGLIIVFMGFKRLTTPR